MLIVFFIITFTILYSLSSFIFYRLAKISGIRMNYWDIFIFPFIVEVGAVTTDAGSRIRNKGLKVLINFLGDFGLNIIFYFLFFVDLAVSLGIVYLINKTIY